MSTPSFRRTDFSAIDLLPETIAQKIRRQAIRAGEGWRLAAGERQLDLWGLQPGADRAFVRARLSDFSLRCLEEPISFPTNSAAKLHRTYIACVAQTYLARSVAEKFGDLARQQGWSYIPTGHCCHVEMPDAFVSQLLADKG